MALDPELQAMIEQRQKQKRIEGLGEFQAAIKSGRRYDPTKPWQDLQRKLDAAQPWATGLSQSEQYYFGKEFEARSAARKRAHEAFIQGLELDMAKAREKGAAARATAANDMVRVEREEYREREKRAEAITGGMTPEEAQAAVERATSAGKSGATPGQAAARSIARSSPEFTAVMDFLTNYKIPEGESGAILDAAAKVPEVLRILKAAGVTNTDDPQKAANLVTDSLADSVMLGFSSAAPSVEPTAPGKPSGTELASAVASILDSPSRVPGDRMPTLSKYFKQQGISLQEATDILGDLANAQDDGSPEGKAAKAAMDSVASAVTKEFADNKDTLEKTSYALDVEIPQKYERAANAYGDLGDLERAKKEVRAAVEAENQAAAGMQAAVDVAEAAAAEVAAEAVPGEAVPGGTAPGEAAPGGTAPGGTAPGEGGITEREQNFFNIISETQGYAPDVMRRMLQAVEDYEDLPTAQSLKAKILDSPQFKKYMENTGVEDYDIAFRLLNREARASAAARRQRSRKAARVRRREGFIDRQDEQEILQEPPVAEPPSVEQDAVARATADLGRLGLESSLDDAKKKAMV
jgi:hypothetical protein